MAYCNILKIVNPKLSVIGNLIPNDLLLRLSGIFAQTISFSINNSFALFHPLTI